MEIWIFGEENLVLQITPQEHMKLPAYSLDLNSIAQAWDVVGRRIATQPRRSLTLRDPQTVLIEKWEVFSLILLNHLINSMSNRCLAILVVEEDHNSS